MHGEGSGPTAVVYVRVSSVGARDQTSASYQTEAEQEERCRLYARSRGYRVIEVVSDVDVSGGTWERRGLERVLELADAGQITAVVVYRLSRLGRGLGGLIETVKRFDAVGVTLMSVAESLDLSSATGRMMFHILGSVDQYERELRGEYWAATKARARGRGVGMGPTPYGFTRIKGGPDSGRLSPNPETAPLVADLYRQRAAGAALVALSELMDLRDPRSDGSAWSTTQVQRILRGRTYVGEIAQFGEVIRDAHEAIVTDQEWAAAQNVRTRAPASTAAGYDFLLSGIVRCAACGQTMSGGSRGGVNRDTPVYRCRIRTSVGTCTAPSVITARRLEEYVTEELLLHVRRVELHGLVEDEGQELAKLDAVVEVKESNLRQLLASSDMQDLVGEDDWRKAVQSRVAERDQAREAASAARLALTTAPTAIDGADALAGDRERLRAALPHWIASLTVLRGRGLSASERVDLALRRA